MNFFILFKGELDAGHNQKDAETIKNPMKTFNQTNPNHNKNRPDNKRSQNTPKQNFMLIQKRDTKVGKDQKEHKDIIDAKRSLDDITGQKIYGLMWAVNKINPQIKQKGQNDP